MNLHDPMPHGIAVNDLDDLIEQAQLSAANSVDALDAALTMARMVRLRATSGGEMPSAANLDAIVSLLETAALTTQSTHDAATAVACARLGNVR